MIPMPLPKRKGPPPEVIGPRPHAQRSQNAPSALQEELVRHVLELPGVSEAESGVSVPGARAFVLDEGSARGPENAFQIGREFAHIHPPEDGSLHMTLPDEVAEAAFAGGWGEPHPISGTPLIFGPRDEAELEAVWGLLRSSYEFATGKFGVGAAKEE
jgi:phospholipase/carboxylesterase